MAGRERPFPTPNNWARLQRSIERSQTEGLFHGGRKNHQTGRRGSPVAAPFQAPMGPTMNSATTKPAVPLKKDHLEQLQELYHLAAAAGHADEFMAHVRLVGL